jgi:hypothetical protein
VDSRREFFLPAQIFLNFGKGISYLDIECAFFHLAFASTEKKMHKNPGRNTMSRRIFAQFMALLAVMAMSLPVLAAPRASKDSAPTLKTTLIISDPVTFAGTQLKPGNYDIVARDSKVTVSRDGQKIAEADAEWRDEQRAPHSSSIVLDGNQVKEVHFGGKTKYIVVSQP